MIFPNYHRYTSIHSDMFNNFEYDYEGIFPFSDCLLPRLFATYFKFSVKLKLFSHLEKF